MVKLLYRFHMYYHVRRALKRLQVPLFHEAGFSPYYNPYTNEEFFTICEDYDVPHDPMRYRDEKFYWTYQQERLHKALIQWGVGSLKNLRVLLSSY